jgi:antirestriction protein ArdC
MDQEKKVNTEKEQSKISGRKILIENRQRVTDQVIKDLQEGKPVFVDAYDLRAAYGTSGQRFSGNNAMLVMKATVDRGFKDPRWACVDVLEASKFIRKDKQPETQLEKWGDKSKPDAKDSYKSYLNFEQLDNVEPYEKVAFNGTMQNKLTANLLEHCGCSVICDLKNGHSYDATKDEIHSAPQESFKDKKQFFRGLAFETAYRMVEKDEKLHTVKDRKTGNVREASASEKDLTARFAASFIRQKYGLGADPELMKLDAYKADGFIKEMQKDHNLLYRSANRGERVHKVMREQMLELGSLKFLHGVPEKKAVKEKNKEETKQAAKTGKRVKRSLKVAPKKQQDKGKELERSL